MPRDPFTPVTPTPEQHDLLCAIRGAFRVPNEVVSRLPDGWRKQKAQEYLEMAAMWATKAVTHEE